MGVAYYKIRTDGMSTSMDEELGNLPGYGLLGDALGMPHLGDTGYAIVPMGMSAMAGPSALAR